MTAMSISNLHLGIPIFFMEEEGLFDKLIEQKFADDIDFDVHPEFSGKYNLIGVNEKVIRNFLSRIKFIVFKPLGAELIIYKRRKPASVEEIQSHGRFW